MKIITHPTELERWLPNMISPAKGDATILEKLSGAIDAAERWVAVNLYPFDPDPFDEELFEALKGVVALHALHASLALLDLVLTPNGLGIVSTETIAPASQHRTEAARADLLRQRDASILDAIIILRSRPEWANTPQAIRFAELPTPYQFDIARGADGGFSWDEWEKQRPELLALCRQLQERWMSVELYDIMCRRWLMGTDVPEELLLRKGVEMALTHRRTSGLWPAAQLIRMVEYIRKRPDIFPEWHSSDTAKLFDLPGFRNEKQSGGFYF